MPRQGKQINRKNTLLESKEHYCATSSQRSVTSLPEEEQWCERKTRSLREMCKDAHYECCTTEIWLHDARYYRNIMPYCNITMNHVVVMTLEILPTTPSRCPPMRHNKNRRSTHTNFSLYMWLCPQTHHWQSKKHIIDNASAERIAMFRKKYLTYLQSRYHQEYVPNYKTFKF